MDIEYSVCNDMLRVASALFLLKVAAAMDISRTTFSRREWLMLIALCLIIEAWILNIGYSFRGDQDVINYISFASTIASLLLAVIAIIYGFLQSDGQQKSAAAIAAQLISMRDAQKEIDAATNGLKGQLSAMDKSTDLLARIGESIDATQLKMGTIEGGLTDVKAAIIASNVAKSVQTQRTEKTSLPEIIPAPFTSQNQPLGTENPPKPNSTIGGVEEEVRITELARRLFRSSSYQMDLCGYALSRAVQLSGSETFPTWRFVSVFIAEPLGHMSGAKYSRDVWFTLGSEFIGLIHGLRLGRVSIDREDSTKTTTTLHPSVLELLPKFAAQTRENSATAEATLIIDKVVWPT